MPLCHWHRTIVSSSVLDTAETYRASSWGSWAWCMPQCCDTCVAHLNLQWLWGMWARSRAVAEHVGCFHAAGQWLKAISDISNITLQLQELC